MKPDDATAAQIRGEAQIAFAQEALRGIVLLNGGAIIALLTFFGQAWSKNDVQAKMVMTFLQTSLLLFVFGALCGIAAQGFAYLSQQYFVEGRRAIGLNLRRVCIALSLGGMYFFAHGSFLSISNFVSK
jgi:hypothetical protein